MKLKNFFRFCQRDPKVVTLLPGANAQSAQDRADAEILLEWRRRVAQRERSPQMARKVAELRLRRDEREALRYLRQAS